MIKVRRNLYRATFHGICMGGHVLAISSTEARARKLMLEEIRTHEEFKQTSEEDLDLEIIFLIGLPDSDMKPYVYMIDNGDY